LALDRGLGGPQSQYGRRGEEKEILPLSLPGIDPRSSIPHPDHNTCLDYKMNLYIMEKLSTEPVTEFIENISSKTLLKNSFSD
jgi:hypothetical protein